MKQLVALGGRLTRLEKKAYFYIRDTEEHLMKAHEKLPSTSASIGLSNGQVSAIHEGSWSPCENLPELACMKGHPMGRSPWFLKRLETHVKIYLN